ncbi:DUF6880 family protein [Synechococcus sp. CS-1328]|uniref:DUF6880 family protein n=1 Tax=Synechococcus sp. CS-1328 TaxID=2847976 RepID=UPI00223B5A1B|nr:DUF6880 family protein [Synechococcus sp. CS-1328]MCT0226009.1 hypothetical protein [Synechococcus sp. CS-1328]
MAAARTTLNVHNLEALGATRLAELLLELSQGNAAAKRRLRLALAEGRGAEEAAQEVRKRLRTIDQAGTFLDAAKGRTLLTELEGQLAAITGSIRAEAPALAYDLHWQLLELSEGILDRCHDGSGTLGGFFDRVLEALPASVEAAQPKPEAAAERIAEALMECNGYRQLDRLVGLLAEPLGRQGLEALRQEFARRGTPARSAVMLAIADAMGDVEAFVGSFSADDLRRPAVAAAVAERLLGAGRADEALAALERVDAEGLQWLGALLRRPRIEALDALGRREEAQQERWQGFLEDLDADLLREYLRRLTDFVDVEAEEEALDRVLAHEKPRAALDFLLAWPDLRRAAELVLRQPHSWDGEAFGLYGPAAEQLEAGHPLAATVLLRAMVSFALEHSRPKRYPYAAQHLLHCAALAPRIDHWHDLPDHQTFEEDLRQRFWRRLGFWQEVDGLQVPPHGPG